MKNLKYKLIIVSLVISAFAACNNNSKKTLSNTITISNGFDTTINKKPVKLYTLKNNKIEAKITNYGGRIVSLKVPNKNGKMVNVVVGMASVKQYINATEPYFGATIGRYGNRIAKGKFTLNGKQHTLFTNNIPNTLHGGKIGYQYVVWEAQQPNDSTLVLKYLSKDGEEGFPGNLNVTVTYSVCSGQGLKMEYQAETDAPTVINLTNHAFFNLNGEGSGTILKHCMQINADSYTPIDSTLIPTGKILTVKNTPFDFRKFAEIGSRINTNNTQLTYGSGYDHNFVLGIKKQWGLNYAATVDGDKSGIVMDIFTNQPGLQFYSGNFMAGKNTFSNGTKDAYRTAFCLETQHFPDSPNQPNFPTTVLKPGEIYKSMSLYKFSVKK